ncbi:ribosome maturation factor RimP [Chitinilyticum piscinae]|uniref:Ribosome maturation factor RimP n=1 Tax=Chitinilyticum piscinae TaxID=2866724 RepID=A0A8J7KA50_9NEIS|nr:ribosome maturation factor RimP [Chitinilyticum piscinae]MBE9608839.1 ribosome maturation factor RimP [Chitinilyticum piscinae]
MAVSLQSLVETTLPGMGYELVDLEIGAGGMVRLFIDKDPGGVTIDDCVAVSNHLTRLFMVEEVAYERLEVSSPGLDRVLKKPSDFSRFAGQHVRVKLRLPLPDKRRNVIGRLIGLQDDCVVVQVNEEELRLPQSQIDRVRLEPQF